MTTSPTNPDEQPTWLPTRLPDVLNDDHDDFGFENATLDSWSAEPNFEAANENNVEDAPVSSTQIEILLSAVSSTLDSSSADSNNTDSNEEPESPPTPESVEIFADKAPEQLEFTNLAQLDPVRFESEIQTFMANDRELIEAYLDDSQRCLGSMEQAAMAAETSPSERDSIQQFCRELHTLKGASATVGLTSFASQLHDLETSLDSVFSSPDETVDVETLFESVDHIQSVIAQLRPSSKQESAPPQAVQNAGPSRETETFAARPPTVQFADFSPNNDSSVRIRASKLDRLMDMLAELVVLRNRRENHVNEFNVFNDELSRCATRLNLDLETYPIGVTSRSAPSSFSEIAKDIVAVSQGMRELQSPVNQDNSAISLFIRDFRQELMQLRRIPVSGLFQRLQRAARDAAKSENKQIQIELIGENVGLEQEIQERLFESLLHVVRNSVSHGIQSSEQRIKQGKNPTGTVTLAAQSSAQLLTIEVSDDGNGVDYEAIRRRAIEKSLISPDQIPTEKELAGLIFHPGFSTREQANAVSGRGVGMEIVARTIEQLHGRVDVESTAGKGTTFRLLIPLRTGIEHVMVFRCDGQLFALPMQSVTAAKSSNANLNVTRLSLSNPSNPDGAKEADRPNKDVLILRNPCKSQSQLALEVDELIGPEEVVVRGLPNLLKRHPLFCGVALSGSGESVLLLNSEKTGEFCSQNQQKTNETNEKSSAGKTRVLVVDDSLTARKSLVQLLHRHGLHTAEAGDGLQAIERLHRETFDLVFTDLDMPHLGGMELLSDIQSGNYCEAPVIVASSRDEETFRIKAMDLGAFGYVPKPVSEKAITQMLDQVLGVGSSVTDSS